MREHETLLRVGDDLMKLLDYTLASRIDGEVDDREQFHVAEANANIRIN